MATDPDLITGYNIVNFDWPYLLDRSTALNIDNIFYYLGRIKAQKATMKNASFSSKAHGTRDYKVSFKLSTLSRGDFQV